MQKLNRLISIAVLIAMIGNMVLVPGAIAAGRPQASDPFAALWEYGETYTTSSYEMLHSGVDLTNVLTYLAGVPYLEANENTLLKAQELALTTANEAARSLGSAGGLSREVEQVMPTLFSLESPDSDKVFWEDHFPAELEAGLGEWNLSQGQIDALESEVALKSNIRQDMATNGLPDSAKQYLQSLGLTPTETHQIEIALGQEGVFRGGMTHQLDRFKAGQYELATVRTQALVVYAQLLTRQISVRRANGIQPQPTTQADLETIADDQLRLLIHVGHLNAQWGNDPDLEKGEGDWWFIERYAGSAANRIAKLLVETQNPGLLLDFFVLKQMETTAITALAGDATYARDELTRLAQLLAAAIGGEEAQALITPLLDSQPSLLAQVWPKALNDYWQTPIESEAQAYARQRVAGLAYPLTQTGGAGNIPETDETNNRAELLFNAGPGLEYDPLSADLIQQMQQLVGNLANNKVFNFIWGVLGGQTDQPMAIVINALLSMIPAVGMAFDIIGLFDPSMVVKAFSLFGILTSLGEVTIVIPVLGQITGSGSFVGDKAIAVTKGAWKLLGLAGSKLVKIADKLPFKAAARFVINLLEVVVKRAIRIFGADSSIWGDAPRLLDEFGTLVSRLWDSLTGLATRLGIEGLLKYGDSEGGMLLGRILGLSDEAASYSPRVAESIARIGDELGEAAADLSDEAAQGLGKLVNGAGEEKVRRFLAAIPCGIAQTPHHRTAGLACPLQTTICAEAVEKLKGLSPTAHEGLQRLLNAADANKVGQVFNGYDETLRAAFFSTFSDIEIDQLRRLVSNTGGDLTRLERFLFHVSDSITLENLIKEATNPVVQVSQRIGLDGIDEMINLTNGLNTDINRVIALATDQSHITKKALNEAKVGLNLEKSGGLVGPIRRYPGAAAEFLDKNNRAWDVKSFDSARFNLKDVLDGIQEDLDAGENIILDTAKLTNSTHVDLLQREIASRGWSSKIKWYFP